jgi:hypothetical protein
MKGDILGEGLEEACATVVIAEDVVDEGIVFTSTWGFPTKPPLHPEVT